MREFMDKARIFEVTKKMKEDGIGQLIVSSPMSVYYLTGRLIQSMERMTALYINADGRTLLVLGKLFPQPEDIGVEVKYYDDTENPVELLSEYMDRGGIIGVDKSWQAGFLLELMKLIPDASYVGASHIVDGMLRIKSVSEQQKMIEASRCNDLAMEKLIGLVPKGFTELEMGERLLKIYRDLGAQGHSFEPIIGYGENAADPHHESDNSLAKPGDCVVLDVGCIKDGYCSDMTRTVFLGYATDEARRIYETVKEANRLGREAVKPGARFCDIDAAARNYIAKQGYGEYFTHRLGHGIGMEVHEHCDVSAANTDIVMPGMCFSIEPGIYVPGVAGVRIEDLVLVTDGGRIDLNNFDRELTIV